MCKIPVCLFLVTLLLCTGWPSRAADRPKAPPKGANEVFVAVFSHYGTPDPVEEKLRLYLGSLPGIDFLLQPDTPDEMFQMLEKITRDGKKIRYLVIAGHGISAFPSIKFSKVKLIAADVDMPEFQKRLTQSLQLNDRENRNYDKKGDNDTVRDIEQFVDDFRFNYRPRHKKLDDVSDAMAEGGEICLLNCSAAATEHGKTMCRNLGQVFLGKRGGTVISSTVDVQIDAGLVTFSGPAFVRTGKWITAGDVWVSGNWMRFDIPAKLDPFLFVAFHGTSLKVAHAGETVEISPQVDARRDSGKLLYSWNGGAPSSSSSLKVVVKDNPQHRIDVKVRVQDALGRVGEDTFTIRIEASKTEVLVSPLEIMASDFFELSCQVPAELKNKVAKYEWLFRAGSGDVASMPSSAPRSQIQLLRDWVGSNFGVRLYDANNQELDVSWAQPKSFTTRKAEFSLSHPGSWQLTRREGGSLLLKKEPTLVIKDSLQGDNGQASYVGEVGGGTIEVVWLDSKYFRLLEEEELGPNQWTWTLNGEINIKRKGAFAFRACFKPSGSVSPNSVVGRQGNELAGRLAEKYSAALAAHRDYTAQQAKDLIASLTVTPGGEVTVLADPGPPAMAISNTQNSAPATATPPQATPPEGPAPKNQAADKMSQAAEALGKGQTDQAVSFAQQAAQLDPQGCKQEQISLAAELKKQGWDAGHNHEFPAARQALQGSLKLNPTDKDAQAKLAKVQQAEAAWPKVQSLGQQVDELVGQRRLVTAYPILGQMTSLANQLLYRNVDMHPYAEAVNQRYHARNEEWNKLYQDTSQAYQAKLKDKEFQGVLDLLGPLETWELSPANRVTVDNMRQAAQGGLAQQAQGWITYGEIKTRFEGNLLDRAETYKSVDKLRLTLQFFNSRDDRSQKVGALINDLDASLRREPLKVTVDPGQHRCQAGQSFQTVAQASGGNPPYRFEWLDEDRPTGFTQASNNWKFGDPGRYVLTAVVTDASNKVCRGSSVVVVAPAPSIQVLVEPAQIHCKAGEEVPMQAQASGGNPPYRFEWLNEDRPTGVTQANNNWNFPSPGRYVVTAVVTDASNTVSRASSVVVVAPGPSVQVRVEPAQIQCKVGEEVPMQAQASGGNPPYRFEWLNEDRPTGITQANNNWNFPSPGRYVVTAVVTDASNTVSRGSSVVMVAPGPSVQVRVEPAQIRCNLGQEVLLEALASGGNPPYRFEWLDEGQPRNTVEARNNWSFSSPGRYVMTAVVTDASNNVGRSSSVVIVAPPRTIAKAPTPSRTAPPRAPTEQTRKVDFLHPDQLTKRGMYAAFASIDTPMTLHGQTYRHYVLQHPGTEGPTEAIYQLGGQASRFTATIGIDQSMNPNNPIQRGASVEYLAYADGRLVWRSGPVTQQTTPQRVDVNLAGVQQLKLVVTDGGNGIDYDWAIWADPVIRL